MIQLDTSFLILALVPGTSQDTQLREWLTANESMGISAIAWTEFLCGPMGVADVELVARLVGTPQTYDDEHASLAARLFNESGRRRGSMIDCMIAAAAMTADSTLATANIKDFSRLVTLGLRLAPSE